ncbi:hypothetical protein, partial [Salipiger sp. PrR003]|uniref:hypothetical protein n=2 Tax=unclassified Salipiger TaxID=2640570 RepID=UPI00194450E7
YLHKISNNLRGLRGDLLGPIRTKFHGPKYSKLAYNIMPRPFVSLSSRCSTDAPGQRTCLIMQNSEFRRCRAFSIAAQVGRPASGFRDISGARVFASVVACTLDGDAAGFREDDMCELHMSEVPSAQNGWRGLFVLLSGTRTLAAKILTGFARRNGRSNARRRARRRSGIALADLASDHDRNRVFL